ncbi:DUF4358 domain-containing protein [Cohnella phaseoli]|uniref:Uncharacterized protein DUF4358 n=1 Tax=Cohnella phaseoli TaxID=456490 RepID=A0A3D9IG41_9BACL|nr:DUF4358 domain-containing protein [Cohnella phaseoli]RED60661.1 uncharacterized protein DUF4358 [Cohnella phaseoli]
MKKTAASFLLVTALLGMLLTACSGKSNNNVESPSPTSTPTASESANPSPSSEPGQTQEPDEKAEESSTDKIVNQMLKKIEQPSLFDLTEETLKDYYDIDRELIEEFTIKTPAINLISNEIAVVKVKDAKNIDAIKKSMEQRAKDVQKMFEQYLPEPYKNAQNYKIAVEGDYVLFLISESADDLVKAFKEAAKG